MDNIKQWWYGHRPTTRRLAQLYSALLYNAHLKGFVRGEIYQGKTKAVCVPGFNCYSCPGAVGACPLGSIQNALASSGNRAGFYVLGIIMLFGLTLGRTICGWFCPLGLLQELLHKIPTPKLRKSRYTRVLSYLKYVVLAVFAMAIPLWYGLKYNIPLPGFCKYICPAGTFEGAMALLSNPNNTSFFSMLGIFFTRKFVILLIIALACIFCYRSFCRFLCPLGAIYGCFNKLALLSVKVDADRCNHCGSCVRSCQMDVRHVGDHECINCARCMNVCKQNALSLKAGKITLIAPECGCAGEPETAPAKRRKQSRVIWGAALAVLCFALLWFNVLEPSAKTGKKEGQSVSAENSVISESAAVSTETAESEKAAESTEIAESAEIAESTEITEAAEDEEAAEKPAEPEAAQEPEAVSWDSDAPVGYEPGMQLEDFSVACVDGSEFHLADTRGKVVFLNLWATYCTPCVQELPHFSDLYLEHKDDIAMLAVHSADVVDDVPEYLADKDWAMPFAVDTDDRIVWKAVNGSSTLPQTIVLNRRGEVIYNQKGSVTAEMLEALYEEAAGEGAGTPGSAAEDMAGTGTPAEPEAVSWDSDAPVGYEPGMQLEDFSVACVDGSEFHLADTRGKVVFLNLWATYCTPCVQELPHFSDLYLEHEDDIAMLAVHSADVVDDVPEYLADKDWAMPFAVDTDDRIVWKAVNGSSTLPQTIVLNRHGEVIYNQKGSVTAEMLEALYEEAAK